MNLQELLAKLENAGKTNTAALIKDGEAGGLRKWGVCDVVPLLKDGTPAADVAQLAGDELGGFDLDHVISTSDEDRDRDVIDQDGWELTNFVKADSPVLFAHNSRDLPVGGAKNTRVVDAKLRSVLRVPPREMHPFGNMVGRLTLHGFGLRAASVGFLPKVFAFNEERGQFAVDFKEQELLEWSKVPIPANPNALAGAKSMGIELEPLIEWATEILDEGGHLIVPRKTIEDSLQIAKGRGASVLVRAIHGKDLELGVREQTPAERLETALRDIAEGNGDAKQIATDALAAEPDEKAGDGVRDLEPLDPDPLHTTEPAEDPTEPEGEPEPSKDDEPEVAKTGCAMCDMGAKRTESDAGTGFHVITRRNGRELVECERNEPAAADPAEEPESEPATDPSPEPEAKNQAEPASGLAPDSSACEDLGEVSEEDLRQAAKSALSGAFTNHLGEASGQLPDF